jgi:hypothetical protein
MGGEGYIDGLRFRIAAETVAMHQQRLQAFQRIQIPLAMHNHRSISGLALKHYRTHERRGRKKHPLTFGLHTLTFFITPSKVLS